MNVSGQHNQLKIFNVENCELIKIAILFNYNYVTTNSNVS